MTIANALNINFAINQLIWGNTATTLTGLPTANNSVLITSAGGVPSWSNTLPLAVQTDITQLGILTTLSVGTFTISGSTISATSGFSLSPGGGQGINVNGSLALTAGSAIAFYNAGNTFYNTFATQAGQGVTVNYSLPLAGPGTNGFVLSSTTAGVMTWIAPTTGSVTSVTGTANRITSTGGTTPVIDISAAYVGQTSIVTVGALTTGSLAAGFTPVPLSIGGTNAALTASNGGIFYSTATAGAILAGTATANQMLQSGASTTPTWSTTTWPATSTINQILYSSAANVVSGLTTANSGTLATSSTGVPSIVTLGATQTLVGVSGGTPAAGIIPGKNMLINGDFQVWQRGAGGSAAIAVAASTTLYTADRWQMSTAANQAYTISQVAGPTSGSYLAQIQRNNGQTGVAAVPFIQSLTRDMGIGAAGNVVTISFKAKAGATFISSGGTVNVVIFTGTGTTDISSLSGFPGAAQAINVAPTLTGTLTNFSYSTAALGSTITQLAVAFYSIPIGTAGATDSISITDVQLEISPVQTPFERRSFGDEFNLCQRFYQKTFDYAVAPAQNVASNVGAVGAVGSVINTTFGANWKLNNLMRTNTPSITTFSPNAASANWSTNTTTPTAAVSQVGGNNIFISGGTAVTVGNIYYIHATAENDVT